MLKLLKPGSVSPNQTVKLNQAVPHLYRGLGDSGGRLAFLPGRKELN